MDTEQEKKIRCMIYDIVEKGQSPGEGLDTWHVEKISIDKIKGNQVHFSIDRHPHLFGRPTRGQASSAFATITYFYKLDMKKKSIEFLEEEKDEPVIDCKMLASEYIEYCDCIDDLRYVTGRTKKDAIAYGNEKVDGWIKDGNFDHYSEQLSAAQMEELRKYIRKEYIEDITTAWEFEHEVPVSNRALFQRIQRKLSAEPSPKKLYKARKGSKLFSKLKEYYIVELNTNTVTRSNINLEDFAEEIGAIAPHEYTESD